VEHDDDLEAVGRQGLRRHGREAPPEGCALTGRGHDDGEVTHPAKVVGFVE
jgi:hypothetical protein